jgi:glycosyltransferase involved in cell wall biosynthesis
MRRVALITHGGLLRDGRGYHVPFLENLIRHLSHLADVTVYTLTPANSPPGDATLDRARVRFLPATLHDGALGRVSAVIRAVAADHRRQAFELLHGIWGLPSGLLAVTLAPLLGIRSVVSLHGAETASIPEIDYGNLARQPHRWLTLRTIRGATALILLSQTQADALVSLRIRRGRIRVIPPASGLPTVEPRPFGGRNFLSVASITPVKDHRFLIEAFTHIARRREARLRIVGEDYSGGNLRGIAASLGVTDRVELAGYVDHARMPEQYAWGDALVVTSRHEAFPLAVAEGAAAGLLIMGRPVGGILDLDGKGSIPIRESASEAFGMRALEALDQPTLVERARREARNWAAGWTLDRVARETHAVYEEALGNGSGVEPRN